MRPYSSLKEWFAVAVTQSEHQNPDLAYPFVSEALDFVDRQRPHPDVKKYLRTLEQGLKRKDFVTNTARAKSFLALLGEAHFLCICIDRGLKISRVSDTRAAPDFRVEHDSGHFFIELKTPGVDDSDGNIRRPVLEKAELRSGTWAPYCGKRWPSRGDNLGAVEVIVSKVRAAYDAEQFQHGCTYLAVNLLHLNPMPVAYPALSPAWVDRTGALQSGILWMSAFARPGMLSFGQGSNGTHASVEGLVTTNGVLEAEPNIAGLIYVANRMDRGEQIVTEPMFHFRSREAVDDEQRTAAHNHILERLISPDVGWNDDVDTNGLALRHGSNLP